MNPDPQKSILLPILLSILSTAVVVGGICYYIGTSAAPTPTYSPVAKISTAPKTSPTVTPTATPITADIASWKTYESKDLGVSFQYPNEYNVTVQAGNTNIYIDYDPNGIGLSSGITISNATRSNVSLIKASLKNNKAVSSQPDKIFAGGVWTVFHYDPTKDSTATDQSEALIYYRDYNNKLYSINVDLRATDKLNLDIIKANAEQLLASFKFTK
jgi:hypothetical protein